MALELSNRSWRLAFGDDGKHCQVLLPAHLAKRAGPVVKAKRSASKCPRWPRVESRYEAYRAGFWLRRHLASIGIENQVADATSIEASGRLRHVRTDRLDRERLPARLIWHYADEHVTGNDMDFRRPGLKVFNPFKELPPV